MRLKRPCVLLIQRDDEPVARLEKLLARNGAASRWLAFAPHAGGAPVAVELGDLAVFDAMSALDWHERDALAAQFGEARMAFLVERGLLIGDHPAHQALRAREEILQRTAWWPPAAVAHTFGRWQGVDVERMPGGRRNLGAMIDAHGAPPAETVTRCPPEQQLPLPAPGKTALDALLAQRSTCRNFDPRSGVPLAELGALLHRVFGAQSRQVLAPGAAALKKNSPSGGGLHPIEAYLLVQRVSGLAPGLYHYHCIAHALEPMAAAPPGQLATLAKELVAGQSWFANAPVLVLMAARFERNFWKYRKHAKAWRVIHLDAGHLSQNLYLSATELGYGAFVTGALNDECAERLFELDGLGTGAIAVCGFGRRAAELATAEFDPLGLAVR